MAKTINTGAEDVAIANLKPHPRNVNEGDFGAIQESIEANGFFGRIVVNRRTKHILAGNHRYAVAKTMGFEKLPVEWVDCDDETELRILLADNRTARLGHDNEAALAALLAELAATERGLPGTGFDGEDLDRLIADLAGTAPAPELLTDPDDVPESAPTRCNPGDLWQLGRHRLLCGDSTDAGAVGRLMDGENADICFTSPPYASQRKYDESSGFKPIPPGEYVDWWRDVQRCIYATLHTSGSFFLNIKEAADDGCKQDYVKRLVLKSIDEWGWLWIEEYCWPRPALPLNPNMSHRFKNGWESVFHFSLSRNYHFAPDNVRHQSDGCFSYKDQKRAGKKISDGGQGLGGGAMSPVDQFSGMAYPSNVLPNFGGANIVGHSAAFPVGLPEFFLKAFCPAGGIVYEPFCGSGTTLIAAESLGMAARAVELSPAYCDIILARWEAATGGTATLLEAGNGRT